MTLSRRTFVEGKRYETVLFQENTHPGDFEMVEFQDYQNREREALAQNLIVDGFFTTSFQVTGSGLSNAVNVTPGSGGYSLGRRLILPDAIHPLVGGQYVYNMAIPTPTANRTDLVYVDVFVETVNATLDPDIQDPVLGPSALRERVRYNFGVSQNVSSTTVPSLPVGHVGIPLALVTRRSGDPAINAADVVDVRPLCSLNPQFKAKNLIVVATAGGDFNDPTAALASVVGLTSASNPFTILIMPGVYTIAAPMNFNDPYVSMIGTDPDACTIRGSFTGFATARINADHIVLKNLTLDYTSGSGSHAATVYFVGNFTATLDNLVLAPFYYNENATNGFGALDTVAGGQVKVRRCTLYAQNSTAVAVGAASVTDMVDCTITAAQGDGIHHANGGTLSMRKCSLVGTQALITSAGTFTAKDCTFVNQVLKAFSVTGIPMTLTTAVTNTMVNCTVDGLGAQGSMTDTTALWNDVKLNVQLGASGGGSSVYEDVQFVAGLDINGTAARLIGCTISGPYANWGIGGVSNQSQIIRGTTSPVFIDCMFEHSPAVAILGGSPTFTGCRFASFTGSARVVDILSTSAVVIIDSCIFQLFASYSLSPVIFMAGHLTLVKSHVQGQVGGVPDYFVSTASFSNVTDALFYGNNTGNAGLLKDPAITVSTNVAL